ncbi:MAG: N-acetylmuramoyl-L-alanine amidase [Bacteroidales bacterium]|nr:N-acetylmuramoyl-L-alanine amidase [Bacteroidales bacterium]
MKSLIRAYLAMALGLLAFVMAFSAEPVDSIYTKPWYGRTLDGAFLLYGNGDDRLGGSKMGFIDSGIPVEVTGESGYLYRLQLSSGRWAYIEKKYVDPAPSLTSLPAVNTGKWTIKNIGLSDQITISLPRPLPYRSWTLIDPMTICIELYGAMDNSNWMTQTGTLGMIDYAYFEQPESDVYKIYLRLKRQYCWGYSLSYQGNSLVIDVRHQPDKLDLKYLTIGLDAGHGGSNTGAVSASGLTEKEVNLDIILRLRDLLEKAGARVVLTRADDTTLSMAERKKIWKEARVDLAVSVHNNSGGGPDANPGTSVYYKHLMDRPLAQCLYKRMLDLGVNDYGLTANFNFALNAPTDYPNALVEALFLSSTYESALLADPKYRQKIAKQIFDGLKDYLSLVKSTK